MGNGHVDGRRPKAIGNPNDSGDLKFLAKLEQFFIVSPPS